MKESVNYQMIQILCFETLSDKWLILILFKSQAFVLNRKQRYLLNIILNMIKYFKSINGSQGHLKAEIQTKSELCNDFSESQ